MAIEETSATDGEITLLGLMAAMAENWKWFLIVPVLAAFAASMVLMLKTPEYRSTAILRVERTAVLLKSPAVLRATIEELNIRNEFGVTMDDAIKELAGKISTSTLAPQMTQVSLVGTNEAQVQSILESIIKNFSSQVSPRGDRRKEIEEQIEEISATVKQMRNFLQVLTSTGKSPAIATNNSNDLTLGYVGLVKETLAQEDKLIDLRRSLAGLSNSDIIQEPMVSVETENRSRILFPVLAAIAAALGVLFVVLINETIRRSPVDPMARSEIKRIKNALPFVKGS